MKKIIGMTIFAGLCGAAAAQVVTTATITPTHIGGVAIGGVEGFNNDLFDGTVTVTDHSALHPATDPVGPDNWFISPNAVTPGHNPPGLLVFADTNLPNYIEFNTTNEVTLGTMVFYLSGDQNTDPGGYEGRSLSNLVVSAGTASTALVEVADIAVNPDYDGAYGLPWIKVEIEFPTPVTAKYFRIDIEQPDIGAAKPEWDWNGPRIREIDAYGTNVATSADVDITAIPISNTDGREGAIGDDFEGVTILTNSPLHPVSSTPQEWFISPNTTENLFDDNNGTKFIDFNTSEPYSLSNVVVFISGDDNTDGLEHRSVTGIRLSCGLTPETVTNNVVAFVTLPGETTETYGSPWLMVSIDLDPAVAIGKYFRIEFDQDNLGARIQEIDGYGVPYTPPIFEPEILSWSVYSNGVMKMVVNAPSTASRYSVQATTDLAIDPFSAVAHSDNGVNPFVVTNLAYSTVQGTNEVIYVQSADSEKFFKIIGE